MKLSPFKFNTVVMLLSIVIFGQALRICEAPLIRVTSEMDHFDFENSMWAVILTMTTGKFGANCSGLWGHLPENRGWQIGDVHMLDVRSRYRVNRRGRCDEHFRAQHG